MASKPTIAISSIDSPNNQFIDNFARSIRSAGFEATKTPYAFKDFNGISAAIYHWPWFIGPAISFADSLKAVVKLALARQIFGIKVVWVAHNTAPHDGSGNRLIKRLFFRQLDGIIYFSDKSRELVREQNPIAKHTKELVTIHGIYESDMPFSDYPALAKEDECRLLNFGLIRPYKGLENLIARVGSAASKVHLTVIGKVHDIGYAEKLIELASLHSNVKLDFRTELIVDNELEKLIDNAHGVVLPYKKILNSGAAIHALSRHRPILVPNQGSMPELQQEVGADWVHLFNGELTEDDLDDFAETMRERVKDAKPSLRALSWERVARDLAGFLNQLKVRAFSDHSGSYPQDLK